MRRHIRLADLADLPTPKRDHLPAALMEKARAVQVSRNLRWDNATGIVRDDLHGELERFSKASDHEPHETIDDVMEWEFSRYIANSASRLLRGCTP